MQGEKWMKGEAAVQGARVVVAVTGSIAAFKAVRVVRLLRAQGAEVFVIMSRHATRFVTPAVFAAASGHAVAVALFPPGPAGALEHIALAHGTEVVVVAPATANLLAKLATGMADDLLSTFLVVVAERIPVLVAPAMNAHMYTNPVVQQHLITLQQRGVEVIAPTYGPLASALEGEGVGRLAEPEVIVDRVLARLLAARRGA
ncbi:MAG: hypothetical protein KatS3mg131_0412 [Candidatus Tectimicrobiota bacterium]|nr:MAG: hypothetical protein KatS3mg131_0412 [Candidatus Tectomicrobia bacterium]